jgi:multisubunit Na+/H+ antiporter MnhC subunit
MEWMHSNTKVTILTVLAAGGSVTAKLLIDGHADPLAIAAVIGAIVVGVGGLALYWS